MWTPADKQQSGINDIIQIEITRRCDLYTCSNCTRLLPFRKDPLQMALDVFTEAVDSLADWPGVVALFGGNPCTHTRFADVCRILAERVPPSRRGLWTNHTRSHGALCREVFAGGRLNLNAHGDPLAFEEMSRWFPGRVIRGTDERPSWHAAILVDYRDLGIAPEAWEWARERCDVNRRWSAILQERDGRAVAYFCEIAGAIDGVTGERHGIPAAPGWWKEPIGAYRDQIRNCCDRGCAIPLRLNGHLDAAAVYDVSPSWLPVIRENDARPVTLQVHRDMPEHCREATDYVRVRG
jgi:hypothetical protein